MKIRQAKDEDKQAIVNLHIASWRENYHEVLSCEFLEMEIQNERLNVWQERFSQPKPNQLILVAEGNGNQFCGFICAFGNFDRAYGTIIDNLHVEPLLKGKGIGSLLLKEAASWADKNYHSMGLYLEVLKVNTRAEAFYKSKGAKKLGSSVWHTPCGNTTDELLYGWDSPGDYLQLN